jgi:hypothetical protein
VFLRRHDVRLAFLNQPNEKTPRSPPPAPVRGGFRSMLVGIQSLFLGSRATAPYYREEPEAIGSERSFLASGRPFPPPLAHETSAGRERLSGVRAAASPLNWYSGRTQSGGHWLPWIFGIVFIVVVAAILLSVTWVYESPMPAPTSIPPSEMKSTIRAVDTIQKDKDK